MRRTDVRKAPACSRVQALGSFVERTCFRGTRLLECISEREGWVARAAPRVRAAAVETENIARPRHTRLLEAPPRGRLLDRVAHAHDEAGRGRSGVEVARDVRRVEVLGARIEGKVRRAAELRHASPHSEREDGAVKVRVDEAEIVPDKVERFLLFERVNPRAEGGLRAGKALLQLRPERRRPAPRFAEYEEVWHVAARRRSEAPNHLERARNLEERPKRSACGPRGATWRIKYQARSVCVEEAQRDETRGSGDRCNDRRCSELRRAAE